jgi:hypothetical protein
LTYVKDAVRQVAYGMRAGAPGVPVREDAMTDRFEQKVSAPDVRKDIRTLGDFTRIYCNGHHRDRQREPFQSAASELGVYGRRPLVLCAECAEHLRYAEKRRAYCPKDPKPFCSYCDTHCYKAEESEWQRQMMRYAGPRSALHGYAIAGIKHALDGRAARKAHEARTRPAGRAPSGPAE